MEANGLVNGPPGTTCISWPPPYSFYLRLQFSPKAFPYPKDGRSVLGSHTSPQNSSLINLQKTEHGRLSVSGSTIKIGSGPSWHGRPFVRPEYGSNRGYSSYPDIISYFEWLILNEDLDYGQNANLLSATANFDSITSGQVYSRPLADRFKTATERLIPTR